MLKGVPQSCGSTWRAFSLLLFPSSVTPKDLPVLADPSMSTSGCNRIVSFPAKDQSRLHCQRPMYYGAAWSYLRISSGPKLRHKRVATCSNHTRDQSIMLPISPPWCNSSVSLLILFLFACSFFGSFPFFLILGIRRYSFLLILLILLLIFFFFPEPTFWWPWTVCGRLWGLSLCRPATTAKWESSCTILPMHKNHEKNPWYTIMSLHSSKFFWGCSSW